MPASSRPSASSSKARRARSRALTLNLALTYLDPKYDSFTQLRVRRPDRHPAGGARRWSLTFGAQYEQPLGNGDSVILRGDFHYEVRSPAGRRPARLRWCATRRPAIARRLDAGARRRAPFTREVNDLNASLTYAMANGLELSVWGRNLLDDRDHPADLRFAGAAAVDLGLSQPAADLRCDGTLPLVAAPLEQGGCGPAFPFAALDGLRDALPPDARRQQGECLDGMDADAVPALRRVLPGVRGARNTGCSCCSQLIVSAVLGAAVRRRPEYVRDGWRCRRWSSRARCRCVGRADPGHLRPGKLHPRHRGGGAPPARSATCPAGGTRLHCRSMIPVVAWLASSLLVLMCVDGTPGPNRFGPDPKDPTDADVFA